MIKKLLDKIIIETIIEIKSLFNPDPYNPISHQFACSALAVEGFRIGINQKSTIMSLACSALANTYSKDYIGYFEDFNQTVFLTEEDFVENSEYKIENVNFYKYSSETGKKINKEELESLQKVLIKEKSLQKELKNLKSFLKEWHSDKEYLKKYFE